MVRTETVATLPPQYLMETETVPSPPQGAPPEDRTDLTLEAYGERAQAIERSNERARTLHDWAEAVRGVYGDAARKSLEELNALKQESE